MDISTHPDMITGHRAVDLSDVRRDSAFGFSLQADSYHRSVTGEQDVLNAFRDAKASGRKVVLRGHGRSYGDLSLGSEAISLDLSRFNSIESFDRESGVIVAQAGASLADIWRYSLPDGWWPPIVSGTMRTSLAGAVSSNIHGKNNVKSGSFGEHVIWIDVISPAGGRQRISADHPSFWEFVGGCGQLGFVVRAAVQLSRVSSGNVNVVDIPTDSWTELFRCFEVDQSDYKVAWVDGFSQGRGVFSAANHVMGTEPASLAREYQEPSPLLPFGVRRDEAWMLLKMATNRPMMRLLSRLKWTVAAKRPSTGGRMMPLATYHFPLDYLPNWERAYRPGALVQFQVAIPSASAPVAFPRLLAMAQVAKIEPYLVVMKRHRAAPGLLPYLADGYSLALDFHRTKQNLRRLSELLYAMTDVSFDFGGRFYLAKDSFLTPEDARRNFSPEDRELFLVAKRKHDPNGILTSNQFRRLGLI